jgi:hypothetical protein
MGQVSKDALREQHMAALEDIALLEAGILRQLSLSQGVRQSIATSWQTLGLGEMPEYEPEVRVRKVS